MTVDLNLIFMPPVLLSGTIDGAVFFSNEPNTLSGHRSIATTLALSLRDHHGQIR